MAEGKRKKFSVMAPVLCGENENTVWVKVGNAFHDPASKYVMKVFLMAVPVQPTGRALELFIYPTDDKDDA